MAKKEQQTYYNYTVLAKDAAPEAAVANEYKSEKQYEEAKTDAAKSGATINVTKMQSFFVTTAESLDEINTVIPNQGVALDYFNYGLTLSQHNVKRDLMRDAEWPGVEGVYDLINDVQEAKEKRVADPLSASRKTLKALFAKLNPGAPEPTDAEINAVLGQFTGQAVAA